MIVVVIKGGSMIGTNALAIFIAVEPIPTPTKVTINYAHSGSFDWNAFWVSFWASLSSGCCYSIFVAFVIGYILWKLQERAEKRSLFLGSEKNINSFARRLKSILDKPLLERRTKVFEAIPFPYDEVEELINDRFDNTWEISLPDYLEFINLVRKFQQHMAELRIAAGNLHGPVQTIITNFVIEKQIPRNPPVNWTSYEPYYLHRLTGESAEDSLKMVIGYFNKDLAEELFERIHSNVEASTSETKYLRARGELKEDVSRLKSILISISHI